MVSKKEVKKDFARLADKIEQLKKFEAELDLLNTENFKKEEKNIRKKLHEINLGRIKILNSNLERMGVSNTIVTRKDGVIFCEKIAKSNFRFDKILLDTPCSGEGTLRSSAKTFIMWNPKMIKKLSRLQKKFFASAVKILRKGGTIIYSTCTHAPEENEEIVSFALENFPVKVETLSLPLKCRPGITEWKDKEYNKDVEKTCRIYPQDNDSEGFFVSKFTLLEEVKWKYNM